MKRPFSLRPAAPRPSPSLPTKKSSEASRSVTRIMVWRYAWSVSFRVCLAAADGHKAARAAAAPGKPYTTAMPAAGQIDAQRAPEAPRRARLGGGERRADARQIRRRADVGLARAALRGRAQRARHRRQRPDLFRRARSRQARRRGPSVRPRQDRGGGGARPDRLPVRARGRRSPSRPLRRLGGEAARRSTPTSSRSARSSFRSSSISSRWRALDARRARDRQRRARRRRAAFLQRSRRLGCWCWSASRRPAPACRTPTRSRRSASRCSSASPAFGSAAARSTRWSTRRRRASPASRAARGRAVPGVAGTDFLRLRRSGAESGRRSRPVSSRAPCRSSAWRRSRPTSRRRSPRAGRDAR